MKKVLLVVGIFLLLCLIGVGGYFVLSQDSPSAPEETSIEQTNEDNFDSFSSNGAYSVQQENIGKDDASDSASNNEQNTSLLSDNAAQNTNNVPTPPVDSTNVPADDARQTFEYEFDVPAEYRDTAMQNKFIVPDGVDPSKLTYESITNN